MRVTCARGKKKVFFAKLFKKKLKDSIPNSWDWRDHNAVTSVKNQDACGICAGEAVTACMESHILIYSNEEKEPDLSESQLFFCSGHYCNTGAEFEPLLIFSKNTGVTKEEFFPFEEGTLNLCKLKDGWDDPENLTVLKDWQQVIGDNEIIYALVRGGPICAGMIVYSDFKLYEEGIYRHVSGPAVGGHGVLIVGYGEEPKKHFWSRRKRFWICKNSWSESFGEKGFFRIGFGECQIGNGYPAYSLILDLNGREKDADR